MIYIAVQLYRNAICLFQTSSHEFWYRWCKELILSWGSRPTGDILNKSTQRHVAYCRWWLLHLIAEGSGIVLYSSKKYAKNEQDLWFNWFNLENLGYLTEVRLNSILTFTVVSIVVIMERNNHNLLYTCKKENFNHVRFLQIQNQRWAVRSYIYSVKCTWLTILGKLYFREYF